MNGLTDTSSSGQNAEEATELLATMRLEHPAMKVWYNNPNNHTSLSKLKDKYGETFPTFWQDLIKWQGWKAVRREYLLYQENGDKFSSVVNSKEEESEEVQIQQTTRGRRRKRWGDAGDDEGNGERARKSRWADSDPSQTTGGGDNNSALPSTVGASADPVMAALGLSSSSAHPTTTTASTAATVGGTIPPIGAGAGLDPRATAELITLQTRLRLANARLSNLDIEAARIDALPRDHPDRSPSPPPVYGPDGTRKNTRANRWREKYTEERTVCLESIMDLIPSMRPPGFISKRKRSRRIDIPIAEYPTYNFIGLIIGPRGKTQKDMENKTGCKIAIRGKGSIKEGAKGRRNGVPMDGDDEPLHVLITGDDPAAIDAAAEMIESMLVVIDDEKNVHKQNQLRELALLNGTLKDEEWCHVCGEKGHKDFECPKRFALGGNKSKVLIKCAICGDTSHPTRDCKVTTGGQAGSGEDQVKAKLEMDADYSAFMAELDGRPANAKGNDTGGGGDVVSVPSAVSVGGISSFCTTIQAARVVIPGEQQYEVEGMNPTIPTLPPAMTGNGDSWITTISSNVKTISATKPVDAISSNVTTISAMKPVDVVNPPTTTDMSNGILASILESASAESKPTAGLPPPSLVGPLPPPPPPPQPYVLPPPPPPPQQLQQQMYNPYQQHQQQPQYNPYHQQYPQQLPQYGAPPPPYGQPPPPPPPYGAPPMQQQWNATSGSGTGETAGWDPNSYYGASNEGAGGFNWWDQSSDD